MDLYYYGIDNNKGGMETYAFNLISNLLKTDASIKIHILTCYKDVSFKDEFLKIGCEIIVLPQKKRG